MIRPATWQARVKLELGELELDVDVSGANSPVALIGPNGSGKTTLLRTVAGAYRPREGRVQLGAQIAFDTDTGIDLPPESRSVGYVPQGYGLFPHLTVAANVEFGLRTRGVEAAERSERARSLLKELGADQLATRLPRALSGGEGQRVALARALVLRPSLLLLDEPLAALDAMARRRVRAFLAEHLAIAARPTLVATHDARDVRAFDAQVFALDAGRLAQSGPWRELEADPTNAFIAEFFGVS